jgi:thioredoxin-related protein
MKKILFCYLLLNINWFGLAQETQLFKTQEQYNEALAFAKLNNKPLFLYFHIDGCGACRQLEKKVFADRVIADYLSVNFICCNINAMKGDGIEINKIYKTQSFPTIIICDTSGTIIGKKIGFLAAEEFLQFCNRSINRNTSLAGMREMYFQGNRSADFLYDYCHQLYGANEIDSIAVNEYLATQKPEDLMSKDNIQFIYTYAITNTKTNLVVSSPAFELMKTRPELFYPYYDTTQVNGRIVWIALQNFQHAIKAKDLKKMQECLNVLSDYISMNYYRVNDVNGVYKSILFYTNNDHLANTIIYQSLTGDDKKYNELIQKFEDENSSNPDALNGMAWTFVQTITDKQKLADAEKWIKQAIAIRNKYAYNDTYAWILFRLGDYRKAHETAEIAILLAKDEEEDFSATTLLVEKINAAME